jgi:type II secretory pathway pseudopilin PulG
MIKKFFKKQKNGFTVVEALVAISILLLAITSAFTVAQSSLQSTNYAKNKITAYYLAQEGLEYIRHLRDNNGLRMLNDRSGEVSWLYGFIGPCSDGSCYVDTTGEMEGVEVCPNSGCPKLLLNTETGQFQYIPKSSTVESPFRRTITVIPINNSEVTVVVLVDWSQNGVSKTLTVSENLYNWQEL